MKFGTETQDNVDNDSDYAPLSEDEQCVPDELPYLGNKMVTASCRNEKMCPRQEYARKRLVIANMIRNETGMLLLWLWENNTA